MAATLIQSFFLGPQRLVLILDSFLQPLEDHFKFLFGGFDLGE